MTATPPPASPDITHCPLCNAPAVHPFADVRGTRYWRCAHCALTFMDPSQWPTRAVERAEYALHDNDPADARYRAFLARLTDHLVPRLPAGARGLDYGCGPGPAMRTLMAQAGFEVTDYDPLFAPDEGALARQYDFITCTEVVEHFHHPQREFARLDRLLRPGGWLGVMTGLLLDDAGFADWHYRRDRTHVMFYKPATFEMLARRFAWRLELPAANVVLLAKPQTGAAG